MEIFITIQDALVQGLINRFKEFRRDKSKPRATCKSLSTTLSSNKGKSPGITKPTNVPQLQVYAYPVYTSCAWYLIWHLSLMPAWRTPGWVFKDKKESTNSEWADGKNICTKKNRSFGEFIHPSTVFWEIPFPTRTWSCQCTVYMKFVYK